MEIFIADQLITMAESCLLGLIFGVGYDIIRMDRKITFEQL